MRTICAVVAFMIALMPFQSFAEEGAKEIKLTAPIKFEYDPNAPLPSEEELEAIREKEESEKRAKATKEFFGTVLGVVGAAASLAVPVAPLSPVSASVSSIKEIAVRSAAAGAALSVGGAAATSAGIKLMGTGSSGKAFEEKRRWYRNNCYDVEKAHLAGKSMTHEDLKEERIFRCVGVKGEIQAYLKELEDQKKK